MAPDLNKFHCFFFIFATHAFLFSRGEKRAKAHDRRVEGLFSKRVGLTLPYMAKDPKQISFARRLSMSTLAN